MKLPKSINKNIYLAYKNNINLEKERKIKAEDFEWDSRHPKCLVTICIEKITNDWAGSPNLEKLIAKDREYFLEVLDTSIPLQILVDNIKNDIFWRRCYYSKWSDFIESMNDKPWINIFMERYYTDILENMNPRQYDPEKIQNLVKLCGPYIESLSIRSLIPADIVSQRITSPEMAELITTHRQSENKLISRNKEVICRDHISLHAALSSLHNLTELHITYQLRCTGINYSRDQFQFTNNDAKNLARGLEKCSELKILRITRSDLNCQKMKYILRGISDLKKLETLDVSHCKIGDEGASHIAKYMTKHDKLRNLVLADNVFGPPGIEVISQVLNHSSCGLRSLDLRLNNKLGSEGIAHVAVSLARGCNLISLNISGCGITPDPLEKSPAGVWSALNAANPPTCGDLLARAIGLAKTPLRTFDISVNNIGSPSDITLSNAICLSYLIDINLKRSGMGSIAMAIAESATAAQRLRRESEKGIRFRRSAGRVVQARRVVKGMNIDADPVLFAQQLSARPSIVSVASEDGPYNIQTQPLPRDFGFVFAAMQNRVSSPQNSSISGPSTSRRSSHQFISEPIVEIQRGNLRRRNSDGSLQPTPNDGSRHIRIYVSHNDEDNNIA